MATNVMANTPKQKKAPKIKHKKLLILISVILIVGIVFLVKILTTKDVALAEEGDSFEIVRPTSGTPGDYSALDNLAIANWTIKHEDGFKTVTTGTAVAKVAVINYTQEINNTRIVNGKCGYTETKSDSALVHVYEQKYFQDGQVVIKDKNANYTTVLDDVFVETYGWLPFEYGAYVINDKSIISAEMEEVNGNYVIHVVLDPATATAKKQRETKKNGNANGYPGFKECELTITLDKDWRTIELDTHEIYDINMPGIGSITCTGEMVEMFEYGKFDIPEQDEFKKHIGEVSDHIGEASKSSTDYLQEIFGPLITGDMEDFNISISALNNDFDGNLHLSLATGVNVDVLLEDIYVNYSDDSVYIKLGENNYKLNINDIKLLLATSSAASSFDTDAIMEQVNNAKINETDTSLTMTLNLELMGIKANADIIADKVNGTLKFKKIIAKVYIGDETIDLSMVPSTKITYPTQSSNYTNIKDILWIVNSIRALLNKNLEINAETTIAGIKLSVDAIYSNGSVKGNILINDKYNLSVIYKDKVVYASFNNINVKASIDEILGLIPEDLLSLDNINLNDIDIDKILDIVKTLSIKAETNKFDIGLDLSSLIEELKDIVITVSKSEGIDVEVNKYGIKASVKPTTETIDSIPEKDYVDVAKLDWLIEDIVDLVKKDSFEIDVDTKLNILNNDISITGKVYLNTSLDVQANLSINNKVNVKAYFKDEVVYINIGNIKLKATIDEITELISKFTSSPISIDLDQILDSIALEAKEKELAITANLSSLISSFDNAKVTIKDDLVIEALDMVTLKVKGIDTFTITDNLDGYIDIADLNWLIDDVVNIIGETLELSINGSYNGLVFEGGIILDTNLNMSGEIKLSYKDLIKDLVIDIYMEDKVIYVTTNNINIKSSIDSIMTILDKFDVTLDTNIIYDLIDNITIDSKQDKLIVNINSQQISIEKGLIVKYEDINASISKSTNNVSTKPNKEYIDVNDLLWLVDDVKDLLEYDVFKINLDTDINLLDETLDLSGTIYVDTNLNVEARLVINSRVIVNVYYNNDAIYVSVGNIKLYVEIDYINTILEKFNVESLDLDLNSLISSLVLASSSKQINVNANLDYILDGLGNIGLTINEGLTVAVDDISILKNTEVSVEGLASYAFNDNFAGYTNLNTLDWLLTDISNVIGNNYELVVKGSFNGLVIDGSILIDTKLNISGSIKLSYKDLIKDLVIDIYMEDKVIYVTTNNINIKSSIDSIMMIVDKFDVTLDVNTLLDYINEITLAYYDNKLDVTIKDITLSISKGLLVEYEDIDISINSTTSIVETKPDVTYIDVANLIWLVDDIIEAIDYEAFNISLNIVYDSLTVTGNIYIDKNLKIKGNLNVNYSGLEFKDINIYFLDDVIYITFGKLYISLPTENIMDLLHLIEDKFNVVIPDIDLNILLRDLLLSYDENLVVGLDLSSLISSMDKPLNLIIKPNFNISINYDNKLTGSSKVTDTKEETVNLPDVKFLTYNNIETILDYASDLMEIVEKWRYNLQFHLSVNGYEVYAQANIVTNKPNPGLNLYGKVILIDTCKTEDKSDDKKYYIEAYIVEEIVNNQIVNNVYVSFSQTIKNLVDPDTHTLQEVLTSTTNQSVEFKIGFDELIETANLLLSGLGIDNDLIEYLITYLGTIVDSNGNFDHLLEDMNLDLDLTEVSEMFDLTQISLDVLDNSLLLGLGKDSNGNQMGINILRDSKVNGIRINNLDINGTVLDGEFDLLEDADIVAPNWTGCLKLDGVSRLVEAAMNNYKDGQIEIEGTVYPSLIGLDLGGLISVPIVAKLDLRDLSNIKAYIYLDINKPTLDVAGLLFANDTRTSIYIENGNIYISRQIKSGGFLGMGASWQTPETRKMSLSDFGADALNQISWICNFGSTVANAIKDADSSGEIKVEEILTDISISKDSYTVTLDGPSLVGSNIFGDIEGTISTKDYTVNGEVKPYVNKITAEATLLAILGLEVEIDVKNIGGNIDWSFFPSSETLEAYKAV